MTDSSPHTPTPTPRPRLPRIALNVTGSIIGLFAAVLLVVGGFALWADGKKDGEGYLSTAGKPFAADTRALATENLDVNLDGAESVLDSDRFGTIRLRVDSRREAPVFVGIARTSEVSDYLRDVAHTTITDIDYDPFSADYRRQDGARRPAPPAEQAIWAASAHGSGSQELSWDVKDGDWSIVVMNEDGSPGVQAQISAAAKLPWLAKIGWGALIAGAILLAGAAALIVLANRSPRNPA